MENNLTQKLKIDQCLNNFQEIFFFQDHFVGLVYNT